MSDPLWKVRAEADIDRVLSKYNEADEAQNRDLERSLEPWTKRGPIARLAYGAEPAFIQRMWREANGNAWMPSESDLRAFLMQLARETERGDQS